ncbi:MAG: GAF domain-containing protein [Nitrospirae bacterium]|nr:GAF domain-containing protein [Nitrospirota bacterium]
MKNISTITSVTTFIAIVISFLVAIIIPTGYLVPSHENIKAHLEADAEMLASIISDEIGRKPDTWPYVQETFNELLSQHPEPYNDTYRIINNNNKVIAERGNIILKSPVMSKSHNLIKSGVVVGKVEVLRSFRPLLINTGIAVLLGLFIGSAIFFIMYILPIRTARESEKALQKAHNELEVEVIKRTSELKASNEQLQREIVERKQAEDALQESENKFKSLAEESLVGIYSIQDGIFKYVNPKLAEIFGYRVEELVDKKGPKDLTLPEDYQIVEENLRKRISGEVKSIQYNFRGMKKNKEIINIEVYGSQCLYQGRPAILGTLLDITNRKRIQEELKQSYDTQSVINAILSLSLGNISLEDILKNALDLILSIPWLLVQSKGGIFLVENSSEVLVMKAQVKLAEPIQKACARVPFGRCLCGNAALTQEIQFADHIDELHTITYDGIIPHGHYCVPIVYADKTLGVIIVYVEEGHTYNPKEATFLTAIARTLAGVIVRKRAEEAVEKKTLELQVLHSISTTLGKTLDLQTILNEVLEQLFHFDFLKIQAKGGIFLVEEGPQCLRLAAHKGLTEEFVKLESRVGFGQCLCGLVAETGEPIISTDCFKDERHTTRPSGMASHGHFNVPLKSKTKIVGVLFTYLPPDMLIDEWQRHLLETIGSEIGVTIENVLLYENVKNEAETSKSLLQIVETLNVSLNEKDLIKNILNIIPKYLKFERTSFFLYDEELKGYVFVGGYGLSLVEEGILLTKTFKETDMPIITKVLKGQYVIVENARESDLLSKELVDTFNIGSGILAPISFSGKVRGGIFCDYKNVKPIESKDIMLLKGLTDGIGIALQNSKLYRESIERMMDLSNKIETIKAISEIDREILASLNRADILKTATALTSRIIPCERVAVLLEEGDMCKVISEWGMGEFQGKAYNPQNSYFERIKIRHSSLFIPNLSEDRTECQYHKELNALGIKSSIIIPLISKGEVLGALDIGSVYYGRLTPSHLSAAERIASQITVALENARLYKDLEQLLINTITSLASAIDAKSPWTKGHSERVTKFAIEIAKEMGLKSKDIEHIKLCGLLHDIGKIGTYDMLLNKEGNLTDEEFELLKRHPEKGAEILQPIEQLQDVSLGVHFHHERYDGKGYPEGLKGEDIPLCARILAVADSFDSMTADRPYRPSPGKQYAITELKRCAGTQFDPKIVEAFLHCLENKTVV